jgi:hypothetical protein
MPLSAVIGVFLDLEASAGGFDAEVGDLAPYQFCRISLGLRFGLNIDFALQLFRQMLGENGLHVIEGRRSRLRIRSIGHFPGHQEYFLLEGAPMKQLLNLLLQHPQAFERSEVPCCLWGFIETLPHEIHDPSELRHGPLDTELVELVCVRGNAVFAARIPG